MSEKETILKPCPFCGGQSVITQTTSQYGDIYYFGLCCECGIQTFKYKSARSVKRVWNRRVGDELVGKCDGCINNCCESCLRNDELCDCYESGDNEQ